MVDNGNRQPATATITPTGS